MRQPACLWYRGILSHKLSLGLRNPLEEEEFVHASGCADQRDLFTDGSGPQRCKLGDGGVASIADIQKVPDFGKRMRAAAATFTFANQEVDNFHYVISSVPGKQTVPRAEVRAS